MEIKEIKGKKNLLAAILFMAIASGCLRKEAQVAEFTVPEMDTQEEVDYVVPRIRPLEGVDTVAANVESNKLIVTYRSNIIRIMNIEQAIAQSGFTVDSRPANPAAKVKRIKLFKGK